MQILFLIAAAVLWTKILTFVDLRLRTKEFGKFADLHLRTKELGKFADLQFAEYPAKFVISGQTENLRVPTSGILTYNC